MTATGARGALLLAGFAAFAVMAASGPANAHDPARVAPPAPGVRTTGVPDAPPSPSPNPAFAWPWTAGDQFVGDERTDTQLFVYVDGRECGNVVPQFTATLTLAPALIVLNRAFYNAQRLGPTGGYGARGQAGPGGRYPAGYDARRHLIEVYGFDSVGRRSIFRFFSNFGVDPTPAPLLSPVPVGAPTPNIVAIGGCSDLPLPHQ